MPEELDTERVRGPSIGCSERISLEDGTTEDFTQQIYRDNRW